MLNIFIYSFVAGLSTVVGVYLVKAYAAWTKKNALYLISFAVGVILATAFFELLPEAVELNKLWPVAAFSAFIALYLLEYSLNIHYCHDPECTVRQVGLISTLGIGFHSLVDGIVIAVGFETNIVLGILTALAVIFHELPEGIFTYTLLLHDNIPEKRSLIYSWLVALATPFGAVVTFALIRNVSEAVLGILLGVAAGTFIYIGSADLIPETHKKSTVWNAVLVLIGVVFVLSLRQILEGG